MAQNIPPSCEAGLPTAKGACKPGQEGFPVVHPKGTLFEPWNLPSGVNGRQFGQQLDWSARLPALRSYLPQLHLTPLVFGDDELNPWVQDEGTPPGAQQLAN